MSSTNEELPPPKPRVSPLDYRNTDLVSRLLAATPPYLYNMPLVPHSYFFSEMLRSFVQAKSQENRSSTTLPSASATSNQTQHRRSRKRAWSQMKSDQWPSKPDPKDTVNWKLSPTERKSPTFEKPLELTTSKFSNKLHLEKNPEKTELTYEKPEIQNNPLPFPMSENIPQSDLILPPPPPMWYPPLYPAPYGIDPLHFFIDLRVSGHIYDRKKEAASNSISSPSNFLLTPPLNSDPPPSKEFQPPETSNHFPISRESLFKQTRHTSAFSVPNRNGPINLSNDRDEAKPFKLKNDERRSENRTSTNYVMQNLKRIYHTTMERTNVEQDEVTKKESDVTTESSVTDGEEQKSKPGCKDLSALIGLELVVDYVKQEKPAKSLNSDSGRAPRIESPDLEIVESQDNY